VPRRRGERAAAPRTQGWAGWRAAMREPAQLTVHAPPNTSAMDRSGTAATTRNPPPATLPIASSE
jgi:hypothetical protein